MKYTPMKYYSDYRRAQLKEQRIKDRVFLIVFGGGILSIILSFGMLYFYGI